MTPSLANMALVLAAGCLLVGFAAGAETGLVSYTRLRAVNRERREHFSMRLLAYLLARREQILISLLVWTNLGVVTVSVLLASLAEARWGEGNGAAVTVVVTLCLFVWGEILPKAFFRKHADAIMASVAPPIALAYWISRPAVFLAQAVVNGVFFVVRRERAHSLLGSREELGRILSHSRGPQREVAVGVMLDRVLRFYSTTVREVMRPLADVPLVSEDAPPQEILAKIRSGGETRIPVYRERTDRIVGLVNVFDVLYETPRRPAARAYLRPVEIVPESKRIDRLLLDLRRKRLAMAVVVNEFGSCIGVVTVEDLMDAIVEDIADVREAPGGRVMKLAEGVYMVDARTDLDAVEREFELELGAGENGVTTVGGLVLHRLGHIPAVGESLRVGPVRLDVVSADRYGVRRLRLTREPPGQAGDEGG